MRRRPLEGSHSFHARPCRHARTALAQSAAPPVAALPGKSRGSADGLEGCEGAGASKGRGSSGGRGPFCICTELAPQQPTWRLLQLDARFADRATRPPRKAAGFVRRRSRAGAGRGGKGHVAQERSGLAVAAGCCCGLLRTHAHCACH
eukprot:360749-Chlamydomonas_euryale.AAC.3